MPAKSWDNPEVLARSRGQNQVDGGCRHQKHVELHPVTLQAA